MKAKLLTLFLGLSLTLTSGLSANALGGRCYALVHGILGFDDTQGMAAGLIKYWGGLDGYLRSQGAKVTTPGSSAANSLEVRASQIQSAVSSWMTTNGCTKVHLIGHSQGGLVIRYMVKNLNFASKTASVTTVNSLHKGAPMADIVLALLPDWIKPDANKALSYMAQLLYRDGRPQDVIAMSKSLTVSYLKSFNTNSPNVSGINYFSYGSQMKVNLFEHPLMSLTHPITWAGGIFYGLGGDNDGVVPFSSQKWGIWKGVPTEYWFVDGIDHLQATNFAQSGQRYYDVQGHYLKIAKNAAGL